ncbi:DHA2 family efflux MFS transporter permease subunit [Streptomyces sp. LX-29]|uniref:MFS transporter n=1 Tax=Streptomyces sp. LX-29 TaxID=2900152 RepID=UPI00240E3546|nr:MFS transporter [Streptomyces sp. LX-29]WFB10931.1 DHA2 family efflux MFS transporter permease subunit [Streptomyces sp. LX-29]
MAKWRTLVAVSLATFMLLLDVTVVNVALPQIQRDLDADFDALRWVIDGYALALAATTLTFGSLGDRIGHRRTFRWGLIVFSLSSLAAGLATTPLALNLCRGVQGIGGSALLAPSLALLGAAYRERDRVVALGVWGAINGGSLAIGPLVGGALVESLDWRAIFWINIPVGALAWLMVLRGTPESRRDRVPGRLDLPGLLALSGGLTALVLALFEGNARGWTSPLILGLFVTAAALLALFTTVERRAADPLLDLGLFRTPSITGASLAVLALATSVFAMLTFFVLYLQNVLGHDALETGLRLMPITTGAFLAAGPGLALAQRLPIRAVLSGALGCAAAGLLLMSASVGPGDDWTAMLAGGVLIGLGVGAFNPVVARVALGTVTPARAGMASGLSSTCRVLGVALGVALLGTVFDSRVRDRFQELVPSAAPGTADAVTSAGLHEVASRAPVGTREQVAAAAEQAFVSGLDHILLLAAALAAAGAVASALLVRGSDFLAESEATPATLSS